MKRDKSFEIFIAVFIVTIIVAVVYGLNKNTNESFYGGDRTANTYNDCTGNGDNDNMLEPDNGYSPPVKGMKYEDSLDSLHIPHVIFDKELNCYTISLAGNKPEDIANYDELVEQMNRLEYNRNIYKDCTIEDIKLVGTHCIGNIHQAAEAIRYNLSHKDNPYNEGYDDGYDAGYETAKRELENK